MQVEHSHSETAGQGGEVGFGDCVDGGLGALEAGIPDASRSGQSAEAGIIVTHF